MYPVAINAEKQPSSLFPSLLVDNMTSLFGEPITRFAAGEMAA